MSQGDHSEPLLLLALFYQSTPSCLKVMGGVCAGGHVVMCRRPCGGVGGPCDFSVSPSPFGLDFGTLDFGTSDLGLTIMFPHYYLLCFYTANINLMVIGRRGMISNRR